MDIFDAPKDVIFPEDNSQEEPISSYSENSQDVDQNESQVSFDSEDAEDEMEDPSQQKSQTNAETKSIETNIDHFSTLHVFGLYSTKDQQQQNLMSFHARLMNLSNPKALFVPELDQLFSKNEFKLELLPVMQGGVDYVIQKKFLLESNLKLFAELKYLHQIKQQLAQQIGQIQESGEIIFDNRRQNYRMMRQRRRGYFRNSMQTQRRELSDQNSQSLKREEIDQGSRMENDNSYDKRPMDMDDDSSDGGRKRYRRTANEIERRFLCWCGKAYGSEGSLNQHKKIKGHYEKQMRMKDNKQYYQGHPYF